MHRNVALAEIEGRLETLATQISACEGQVSRSRQDVTRQEAVLAELRALHDGYLELFQELGWDPSNRA